MKLFGSLTSKKNKSFDDISISFSILHFLSGNPFWFCRIWVKYDEYSILGKSFGQSYGKNKFEAYRNALNDLNPEIYHTRERKPVKRLIQLLTKKQIDFFFTKNIKVGNLYRFPAFGFSAYTKPELSKEEMIDTNPFTKSLGSELFVVKEKIDGFLKGNFHSNPKNPDFYVREWQFERRLIFETIFLFLICVIPFLLYNNLFHLFNKQTIKTPHL